MERDEAYKICTRQEMSKEGQVLEIDDVTRGNQTGKGSFST